MAEKGFIVLCDGFQILLHACLHRASPEASAGPVQQEMLSCVNARLALLDLFVVNRPATKAYTCAFWI